MAIGSIAAGEAEGIERWINVKAIQILTHHASGVVVAVVLFWMVGWLLRRLLHEGVIKRIVLLLDELVLLLIFLFFAYELLIFLFIRVFRGDRAPLG
ncbi:MAG TPA: hypothetical protein VJN94_10405 [Candidatus Binataceae bacterium]|nr:hypothetical protein [Candidatus Binataceae bacterium]